LVFFQEAMAATLSVPVFMSSLLQLPMVRHGLRPEEKVGILMASGSSLTFRHPEIATDGVPVDSRPATRRFLSCVADFHPATRLLPIRLQPMSC